MTNEKILYFLGKSIEIGADLVKEAEDLKDDAIRNPSHVMVNYKQANQIMQQSIVLKKLTKLLAERYVVNLMEGSD